MRKPSRSSTNLVIKITTKRTTERMSSISAVFANNNFSKRKAKMIGVLKPCLRPVVGLLLVVWSSSFLLQDNVPGRITPFYRYRPAVATDTTSGDSPAGLTLIGAGFGRTGTKSNEVALTQLDPRTRVYDIRSIMEHNHADRWIEAAKAWKYSNQSNLTMIEELVDEIEELGYTTTLDMPMNLFAIPLSQVRPNAKVMFSVRDNEQVWAKSLMDAGDLLHPLFHCKPWRWIVPDIFEPIVELLVILQDLTSLPIETKSVLPWYEQIQPQSPEVVSNYSRELVDMHQRFQKELEARLSPDRLLIFNVKQGWGPLKQFLLGDADVEEEQHQEPFPHVNDRKSLQRLRRAMDIIAITAPVWILLILYLPMKFIYGVSRLIRTALYSYANNRRHVKRKFE